VRLDHDHHLAYCTNIHPAESWEETLGVLNHYTLAVRDRLDARQPPRDTRHLTRGVSGASPYAIGLRLSARAAAELLEAGCLDAFRSWLDRENCYVFTINGFPYGAFHHTRVKEDVYRPDWTTPERLAYTNRLFEIIARLVPDGVEGSVSTLPGSFKAFQADEHLIFENLESCARRIEDLSERNGCDLHLGLEPEPLGHFENTAGTLAFFERLLDRSADPGLLRRRLGINYDTCHFAVEFDDCRTSLDAFRRAGLRLSKIHLSNALAFDPSNPAAPRTLAPFDEPTYLHQVILNHENRLVRHPDLPDYLSSLHIENRNLPPATAGRIHFHIPLYAEPAPPLQSTSTHVADVLAYRRDHPGFCSHFEIETYTWSVLPEDLQSPLVDQITREYRWILDRL